MRLWLRTLRKDKGVTQAALAKKVGVSQVALCNIESGKRRPSVDVAKKIAAVLGFEWTRFYETADQPFPTDDAASRAEDGIRRMVV